MANPIVSAPSFASSSYNTAPQLSGKTKALLNSPGSHEKSGDKSSVELAARKAAEEFENVFVSNVLETLFSGLNTDPPFGGGQGEKVFRSFLLNEYAQSITGSGGFGIADQVYREILAAQEGTVTRQDSKQ